MTKAAATRWLVIEREMPHAPAKVWRALMQGGVLVRMEQSGFRPQDENNCQGAKYGWQKYVGAVERVAAGLT